MNFAAIVCAALALALTLSGRAQEQGERKAQAGPVVWKIDNLKKIGGHATTAVGDPRVIKTPGGKAVLFDGVDDGLVVDANPVAGAHAFTVEAVFRPDAGGSKEQRWLHIQGARRDDRVLLETRLVGDEWFLDTFIKSGEQGRTLYAENFKHPLGRWYHVALVYDGSVMRHYVDGREELSGPLSIGTLEAGRTSIGVRMNRIHWFKGAVRRARFTPRALRPAEFMGKD